MVLLNKNKKSKKPIKISKLGFEIEFHIVDEKGKITNKSLDVIKKVKEKNPEIPIIKECGMNFIEINSFPSIETYNTILDLLNSIKKVNNIINKEGLYLYPFGMYPNKFKTIFCHGDNYEIQEKIFGSERFKLAPYSAGFHCHYTLPRGVYDNKKKDLKVMLNSKIGRSLVNSFNFSIAADPVITLFSQSSPFFDGKQIAKDCKNLVYRGGKKLNFEDGIYTKLQMFANLPPYKHTQTDIIDLIEKRWKRWTLLSKKADPKIDMNKIYKSKLDVSWNPIKINKVGTLEHRSPNTNFMSICFAVAIIFKWCHKRIQRDYIEVLPSDLAIKEPFKFENNILYIPPHSYVRNKIQKWSIYDGFENEEMYKYAKRFFLFAKSITPKKYHDALKVIENMIDKRKSMSDRIIDYCKRKKLIKNGKISKSSGQEIAKHFSNEFKKDLDNTINLFKKFSKNENI